jgi:hypothetical protein
LKVCRICFSLLNNTLYLLNYLVRIFFQKRQKILFFAKHSIYGLRYCFRRMHFCCVFPSNISYNLYCVIEPTRCNFWILFLIISSKKNKYNSESVSSLYYYVIYHDARSIQYQKYPIPFLYSHLLFLTDTDL